MNRIYLIAGVPAAGKSWALEQLTELFEYVHHDLYIGMTGEAYFDAIKRAAETATRPLLVEAPFSISQTKDPLEEAGFEVVPVFILADPEELERRWDDRGEVSEKTRKGHLSRQRTYQARAEEWGAFQGTSEEVLEYLKAVADTNRALSYMKAQR